MAIKEVEKLLLAGGSDKDLRHKFNQIEAMEDFVSAANEDGFDFTQQELVSVLDEEGDSFESSGNPRSRSIWWR
ncbi:MAG: Nif11-like leader peptide family natural product precursor [Planctomycetes bacterium]|nr:Nif11-like leader peptide family natural product precursor [Planctomycetota bacterium]